MTPRLFLALLAAIFIVVAAILLQEELFSALIDPDTQVELAENWGLAKAGKPRPGARQSTRLGPWSPN
ncbi:hypothetical protein, partial [Methylomagnum sp.]